MPPSSPDELARLMVENERLRTENERLQKRCDTLWSLFSKIKTKHPRLLQELIVKQWAEDQETEKKKPHAPYREYGAARVVA